MAAHKPVPMSRYYAAAGILTLLVAILAGVSLRKSLLYKDDNALLGRIRQASYKIDEATSRKSSLPESLSDGGVTGASGDGITYQHIDAQSYALCGTFDRQTNGFTRDEAFQKQIEKKLADSSKPMSDSVTYIENTYAFGHPSGYVCFVTKPYSLGGYGL